MIKSVAVVAALVTMATSTQSMAASILDAASKTALETGFQQIQDTAADILVTTWPFFLAVLAVLFAPKFVKRLANKM